MILEGPAGAPSGPSSPEDSTMTVDLLPPRVTPDVAPDSTTPSRDLRTGISGWAEVEQNCPYCAGPETD